MLLHAVAQDHQTYSHACSGITWLQPAGPEGTGHCCAPAPELGPAQALHTRGAVLRGPHQGRGSLVSPAAEAALRDVQARAWQPAGVVWPLCVLQHPAHRQHLALMLLILFMHCRSQRMSSGRSVSCSALHGGMT